MSRMDRYKPGSGAAWVAFGILAALLFAAAAGLISPARGHGDAEWIQQEPRYVTATGVHCCSPVDCGRAPAGSVELRADGWHIAKTGQTFDFGDKALYVSIDRDFWWCVRGERVVCLFVPGAAS